MFDGLRWPWPRGFRFPTQVSNILPAGQPGAGNRPCFSSFCVISFAAFWPKQVTQLGLSQWEETTKLLSRGAAGHSSPAAYFKLAFLEALNIAIFLNCRCYAFEIQKVGIKLLLHLKNVLLRVIMVTHKWKNLHLLLYLENISVPVVGFFPLVSCQETGFSLLWIFVFVW